MNINEALEYGINLLKQNKISEPSLKSRLVLCNLLNQNKEYLIMHEDEKINQDVQKKYIEGINKLCNNYPLQYVTNKQEFMKLNFYVNEKVLIPQPDTEILVEEVISICRNFEDQLKEIQILDLCTGSGAIGISLAKYLRNSNIILSDISKEALEIARKNYRKIAYEKKDSKIRIIQSDLFEKIDDKFDIIVSNPPYIKTKIIKTLDKEVQKEPKLALDGGKDGLDIYRRIINEAYKHLNTNGYLCLEIGYDQKNELTDLIKNNNNYGNIYFKKDLGGHDRIVICKKES